MGYFDFVEPNLEQDDTGLEPAKSYVPQGWQVRRKGKDYWENDQTEASPEDELRQADTTPTATADEMKTYSQRRGESTSQVFKTADQIISKYESLSPELRQAAAKARQEVRAKPEDAAKILENFFNKSVSATRPGEKFGESKPFAAMPQLYDQDFTTLENNVRGLRTMKRGAEEQTLTGGLAQTDLQKNLTQLQNLRGQLDQVTKDLAANNLPEAVSGRGEVENKKILGAKQQQAAALAEHIKQLENLTGQQTVNAPPKPESPTLAQAAPNLDLKGDIDSNIKASGRDPRDFRLAMVAAAKTLEEKTGLDTMALKDRVPFQRALLSALQIFDPAGIIVSQLANDMQPSAPPAGSDTTTQKPSQNASTSSGGQPATQQDVSVEEDQHTQNIRKMQADRRQLYNELGQTPELQSWLGVLTFVFLSVITRSPAVAASILGISRRQGNLKMQLDLIEKEMHEEGGMLRDAQKRTEFNRKLAAEHSLRRQDKAEDFQNELQKMYLNHKLILQREAARNPENKNAYKQLENSFVRQKTFYDKAQHKKDEAQRILSNDFSDEALKAKAQVDFNNANKEMKFYEGRLRDLDAEIRKYGGIQFSDEQETQQ